MVGRRKPLEGVGLLARCECFLKREKFREKWRVRVSAQKRPRRVQACRVQAQTPLDEAKLAKRCDQLIAYLMHVGKASQATCANAMGLSFSAWVNFLTEATWRLPLWEDDNGAIGLCRHKNLTK